MSNTNHSNGPIHYGVRPGSQAFFIYEYGWSSQNSIMRSK